MIAGGALTTRDDVHLCDDRLLGVDLKWELGQHVMMCTSMRIVSSGSICCSVRQYILYVELLLVTKSPCPVIFLDTS